MQHFQSWFDKKINEGLWDSIKSGLGFQQPDENNQIMNKARKYLPKYLKDLGFTDNYGEGSFFDQYPQFKDRIEQAASNILAARVLGVHAITRDDLETLWRAMKTKMRAEDRNANQKFITTLARQKRISRPISIIEISPKDMTGQTRWKIERDAANFNDRVEELQKAARDQRRTKAKARPQQNPNKGPVTQPGSQPQQPPPQQKNDIVNYLPELPAGTKVDLEQVNKPGGNAYLISLNNGAPLKTKFGVNWHKNWLHQLKRYIDHHIINGGSKIVVV